ncbi:D-alanyl-D-alanine carboxypeptidase/D-alanyl-D-alanine-endopeptidase [Caballeronia sp. LZ035]|uniref:D-alanyl-D-alanine carboxypeptidase/D-alanyl-D-alanine endopeptidase n=1 Tax=Caballeronia sp. LZ035 TaxID=3038568 RepID=UPI00285DB190|nr:D-alanyl-D-alanine carboxypeptidase/D-alanyl-D-alanine-endopeptidase [Caballeronia sp. LZ035]MDR5756110.1 D-alanyl-D-alanine carboxypeptidase/D-alanyl-D-alanine-endopeptidase [Caballeronia sp. LZ035]
MPLAFRSVYRRLAPFTFAVMAGAVALGAMPEAHARGGTKAEAQAHAPERAARGGKGAKGVTPSKQAAKAGRAAKISVPAGPLPASVMTALARAHVPLSSMSVVVQRVGAPVPLVAINANEPMLPASTMKLVTTFSGLSILGPDYRWKTTAYADGELDAQGVLHGNLYIQGTGDPKLVPEELIDLVEQIRKSGITGIDGALVLDKRYFDVSTRDLPAFDNEDSAPYNVGPDPLLYAFKSLSFTLTPGTDGQVAIDVLPQLAQLQIDNELRVTRGACVGSLQAASPSVAQVQGGFVQASFVGDYPLRCGPRTVNVAALDHSTFFAGGFLALWKQAGGTFQGTTREGPTPSNARLVGTHRSPVLSDVVRDINKFSNNVMARNLFLTIGATQLKPPATTAKSSQAIQAFLRRSALPMNGLVLDNGSGLSRDEHISAISLADLLLAANASPVAQVYIESLPIAGVDGTMRNRLTNAGALGNAHIKTGTLRDVRAIAGYVGAENGESYVVVSFINDPRAEAARAAHDALLEWVYEGARKAGVED